MDSVAFTPVCADVQADLELRCLHIANAVVYDRLSVNILRTVLRNHFTLATLFSGSINNNNNSSRNSKTQQRHTQSQHQQR